MLIIRGVNVFPTQIEEQVLKIKQLSENYEIHLYRNGNLDSMDVHVELKHDLQGLDGDQQKLIGNELSKQIKTYIGISARVLIQPSHSLKRSEGKACHVFDKRNQG
ncbi:Phenylacetate-coenzyme A ligase [compost metagenome]